MRFLIAGGGELFDESLCKDISFFTVSRDGTITNEFYLYSVVDVISLIKNQDALFLGEVELWKSRKMV